VSPDAPAGSVVKAALMGGLLTALFSANPYTQWINCCCCGLPLLGGAFAAWTLETDSKRSAGRDRQALAGAVAGFLGGALTVPLGALLSRLAWGQAGIERQIEQVERILRNYPQPAIPGAEAMMRAALRASAGAEVNAWTVFSAAVMACVFALFGLLGALLASHLRTRRGPPAGRVVPPPVPAMPPEATSVSPTPAPAPGEETPRPAAQPAEDDGMPGTGELPPAELPELPGGEPSAEPRGTDAPRDGSPNP
jgi:hypothetical protein